MICHDLILGILTQIGHFAEGFIQQSVTGMGCISLEGQIMLYNRLVVLRSIAVSDLSGEISWKS